jgi:hypothetical protein
MSLRTTMLAIRVSAHVEIGLAFLAACPLEDGSTRWVPMRGIRDRREMLRGRWVHRELVSDEPRDPIDRLDFMRVEELPGFHAGIIDDARDALSSNFRDLVEASAMNTGPVDFGSDEFVADVVGVFAIDADDFAARAHVGYGSIVDTGVKILRASTPGDTDDGGLWPFVKAAKA